MNKEDVIKLMLQIEPEMAIRIKDHEEGLEGFTGEDPKLINFWPFENYVKFARLVYESVFRDANIAASRTILDAAVLAEREAIAQMIENAPTLVSDVQNDRGGCLICGFTPTVAAKAIRERSNP